MTDKLIKMMCFVAFLFSGITTMLGVSETIFQAAINANPNLNPVKAKIFSFLCGIVAMIVVWVFYVKTEKIANKEISEDIMGSKNSFINFMFIIMWFMCFILDSFTSFLGAAKFFLGIQNFNELPLNAQILLISMTFFMVVGSLIFGLLVGKNNK